MQVTLEAELCARRTMTADTWHKNPNNEKRISPAAAMMQPVAVRATIARRKRLYSWRPAMSWMTSVRMGMNAYFDEELLAAFLR